MSNELRRAMDFADFSTEKYANYFHDETNNFPLLINATKNHNDPCENIRHYSSRSNVSRKIFLGFILCHIRYAIFVYAIFDTSLIHV